jgi:hypothetical protein
MEMEMKMKKQKVVARIRSASSRRVYKIVRTRLGIVCPCFSFRYAKGDVGSRSKRCRHMDEAGL